MAKTNASRPRGGIHTLFPMDELPASWSGAARSAIDDCAAGAYVNMTVMGDGTFRCTGTGVVEAGGWRGVPEVVAAADGAGARVFSVELRDGSDTCTVDARYADGFGVDAVLGESIAKADAFIKAKTKRR